jgi:hypothetical protein
MGDETLLDLLTSTIPSVYPHLVARRFSKLKALGEASGQTLYQNDLQILPEDSHRWQAHTTEDSGESFRC